MLDLVGRIAARGNAYARMRDGRFRVISCLLEDHIRNNLPYKTAIRVRGDEGDSFVVANLPDIRAVYFCKPFWAMARMREELLSVLRDHSGSLMWILAGL